MLNLILLKRKILKKVQTETFILTRGGSNHLRESLASSATTKTTAATLCLSHQLFPKAEKDSNRVFFLHVQSTEVLSHYHQAHKTNQEKVYYS